MISNLASSVQVFTSNSFLVTGERTALVDPGNEFDVVSAVEERADDVDAVLLTHTHPDHVGNTREVVEAFHVDVWGFDPDHELVDRELEDGATVRAGDHDYEVLHTPGHADDHVCLYADGPGTLFAGDLIFANGSFGRTDLEEGDRDTLIRSIERVLGTVDGSLSEMHTGHGPSVTNRPYDHIQLARQAATM